MNLFNLIENIDYEILQGSIQREIKYITIDSRNVRKNTLFVCIEGLTVDGHIFIENAIKSGAVAILVQKDITNIPKDITIIKVNNTRNALSYIASNFYNNPVNKCELIGVTGTNGKTSSTYFMESILKENNKNVGIIGTIDTRINGEKVEIDFATSTTPDSIELQHILNYMVEKNVDNVIMEVSSHALELHKVDGFSFKTSIFTNLTQDHLDLHVTMENYKKAKGKLFAMSQNSIINIDDPAGDYMISCAKGNVITYSIEKESDLQAYNINYSNKGVSFCININNNEEKMFIPIPGKFSLYNALGVIAASLSLGVDIEIIKLGLSKLKGVPGRIQNIENNKGISVIVDYAHTPDSLENIIKTVKEFTKGKVITIFGCGGDRDKGKRSIMGKIAGTFSDICIITSDNPRTEEPENILNEIEEGIKNINENYVKIIDRRDAIEYGIKKASEGDSIIIAGKGHEDYQIFKKETIYFDDCIVAKEILAMEEENK